MPRISVIIPARNAAGHINETLRNFQKQSFEDFEVIICDNNSTDDTGKVAERFCRGDARFKLCEVPAQGAGVARNYGLTRASGEIVVFFDADDRPETSFLGTLSDAFAEEDVDCVISDFRSENQAEDLLTERRNLPEGYADAAALCVGMLVGRLRIAPTTIAHRRSMLAGYDVRYLEGVRCFEDMPLWFESALASRKIKSIAGCYAAYVIHEEQATKETSAREDQFYCERAALDSTKERVEKLRGMGKVTQELAEYLTAFIDEVMFPHLLVKHMSFCLKNRDAAKYLALYKSGEFEKYIINSPKKLLFKYFKETWIKTLALIYCPALFERRYSPSRVKRQ